jgi:hypothetical protein
MLEKLMRTATVAMGCTACMTTAPMTGDFVRRYGVAHTTSQAWTLGDAVMRARAAKTDPVATILAEAGEMIRGVGAPFPLGPGLRLGGDPFVAKRSQNAWTVILPKPETGGSDGSSWRAASIRLSISAKDIALNTGRLFCIPHRFKTPSGRIT